MRVGIDPLCLKCTDLYDKQACNVSHVAAIGEHLPIREGVIDTAIIVGVLDHCLNPDAVLKEICRTLRKGGSVFLSVYIFQGVPRFIRNSLMKLVDRPHPYHFSQQQVAELSKQAGLTISASWSNIIPLTEWISAWRGANFIAAVKTLIATLLGFKELLLILKK